MKTCGKCKAEKPTTEFSKYSRSKDGLQFKCKACAAAHYNANREHVCKRVAAWRIGKEEHIAQYMVNYSAANKSRISAYKAENRERLAKREAEYKAENRERIAAQKAAYRLANPDKHSADGRNRRARIRNAEGTHTATDITRILDAQRGLCANCHAKLFKSGKNKFHADHIIPLAKGGSNWPDNIQCLCPTCNTSKHAKDPIEWARQNGRLI